MLIISIIAAHETIKAQVNSLNDLSFLGQGYRKEFSNLTRVIPCKNL